MDTSFAYDENNILNIWRQNLFVKNKHLQVYNNWFLKQNPTLDNLVILNILQQLFHYIETFNYMSKMVSGT